MRKILALIAALVLFFPLAGSAQDGQVALEAAAKAMGTANLKSIEYTGSGVNFAVGQSVAPGAPWPRFDLKSYTRSVNYETASHREDLVRSRADSVPRGGGAPAMGEARQTLVVNGDHAWNVTGPTAAPAPVALIERQLQLWTTPHGVIKAAMANNATVQGRTIAFAVPGRFTVKASLDDKNLVERVEAVFSNAVVGDMPFEVSYSDYRDFGGVKFPMRIHQTVGAFPTLDLTVNEVRPNAPVDIQVPDNVRQATNPYSRVTSQVVTEGVWYLSGGTHHSVAIEMKDYVIVVDGPLNDERAVAVIGEVKRLAPNKPIRYVVNSHHHFDHSGGIRAFVAEGATVVTHEVNRPFFERALAAPAAVTPDRLAKAPRKATVEGVRDKLVLTDGTRTVEILHIAGNLHADGLLMVYLPREKLLSQADAYSPLALNVAPPAVANPNTVNLADNITRLGLAVDQLLPLHGRIVPLSELNKTIGRSN
jgi:glyoxylase-like metal-dependent hydrolase (beta-lactamase superfamily II)